MSAKQLSPEREAALAAYNEIVEKAELVSITLVATNFLAKPEYYKALSDDDEKLRRGYGSTFSGFSYDGTSQALSGQFEWGIEATLGRKKLLHVKATYFIVYEDVPDVGNEHAEAFIKRVGKFATYPYFRALVSQISAESRANLPIMPVLK